MAITKNSKLDWTDIQTIYTALNQARAKFSFPTVTIPNNENIQAKTEDISSLKSLIEAMSSNGYVGNNASTSSVPTPAKGDKIVPDQMNSLKGIIDKVNNICAHDASFNAGNYSYNAANYGYVCSFNAGNYGFNSSNYGFDSSNNGWNSGNYSWNSGNYSYNNSNVAYNSSCVTVRR